MKKFRGFAAVLMSVSMASAAFLSGCAIKSSGDANKNASDAKTPAAQGTKPAEGSSPATPTIKLRFGNTAAQGTTLFEASNLFKKEVEEKTKGAVTVDYYPGGVLGGDAQVVQQIVAGTADMNVTDIGLFASYEKKLGVLSMPFMYSSLDQAWKVMDSPVSQNLVKSLDDKGIHVLGFWENGFRDLTTNSKSVKTAADVNGMKLRVPQIPSFVELWKTLGANPTPMDLGQVYMGLQQGVVEGQENPLEIINNNKLYEVEKYLVLTHHVYSPTLLVISEKTWQKLSPDQQKALEEAAKDVSKVHREKTKEHSDELLKVMKDKMTVVEPDINSFKKAAEPMYKWAESEYGADLVKAVKDEAEKDK